MTTTRRLAPRSLLGPVSEALTLAVMIGLTVASATALASGPTLPTEKVYLLLVEVTATPATVRLPTVVVQAKRVNADAQAD